MLSLSFLFSFVFDTMTCIDRQTTSQLWPSSFVTNRFLEKVIDWCHFTLLVSVSLDQHMFDVVFSLVKRWLSRILRSLPGSSDRNTRKTPQHSLSFAFFFVRYCRQRRKKFIRYFSFSSGSTNRAMKSTPECTVRQFLSLFSFRKISILVQHRSIHRAKLFRIRKRKRKWTIPILFSIERIPVDIRILIFPQCDIPPLDYRSLLYRPIRTNVWAPNQHDHRSIWHVLSIVSLRKVNVENYVMKNMMISFPHRCMQFHVIQLWMIIERIWIPHRIDVTNDLPPLPV